MTTFRFRVCILLLAAHHFVLSPLAFAGQSPLRKGAIETAFVAGTTLPVTLFRAHEDRRLTMGAIQFGRVLTNDRGRRPFAGSFELLLEVAPLVVLHQPDPAVGIAASPLHLRWNFRPSRQPFTAVFAEANAGIIYTNRDVRGEGTNFNFMEQAGFGIRFAHRGKHAWVAGYRFQHISNGGRIPPNTGDNFNFIYTGLTILR